MLLGNADESFVVGFRVTDERAVGFDDNIVLPAVLDGLALLAPGMKLHHSR
jgi:hypothetical protein